MKNKKSLKFSLIIITLSIIILFAIAVTLPWLVTWYVETKQKDAGLPTLIMLVCYPCLPFAAVALFSLRKLIKNCLGGLVFGDQNIRVLKTTAICCLAGAVITLVAGRFYIPFYFVSIAAAGCALIAKTTKDIFAAELEQKREELYESVKDEL
ncbi:MAG: hypothetical protein Q4B40_03695 [Clostridia bacterium]|nr:hypothetical protein [Clostridia bacterium]